jgi:hypothetical protein
MTAMNTPLPLHDLAGAIGARGTGAYVLTVSEPGVPHVVHAEVVKDGDRLLAVVGAHTADNARRQPRVSLLYTPRESGDYSLIVDAVATVEVTADGERLILAATRAVLHRSGPAPDPTSSCGADCQPLALGALGRGRSA